MIKKYACSFSLIFIAIVAILFPCSLNISASDKCTINIDYNSEEIIDYLPAGLASTLVNKQLEVESGETITIDKLSETLRCYYTCVWTVNNVAISDSYVVTGNATIKANWTPVEYTIHYNFISNESSEVSNLIETQKYTIEDGRIHYYRPERKNYIFLDWYTSLTMVDQFLTLYKTEYAIGDIFLYAKWKPKEFKINYNTDANNIYNPPTYNVEHDGFDLVEASKEGHIFEGWYLDKEYTTKCTRIDKSFEGDINLYPKFTPKIYTVTYILPNGEKTKIDVEYGKTCALPKVNKNIFQIVKLDVSRKNITGDTTIKVSLVNIWYVYLIGFILVAGIISLIVYAVIKRKNSMHRLRYVYNTPNKKNRRWK